MPRACHEFSKGLFKIYELPHPMLSAMGLCSGDYSGASKQDPIPAIRNLTIQMVWPDVRPWTSEITPSGDMSPRNSKDGIRKVLERKHRFLLYPLLMSNVPTYIEPPSSGCMTGVIRPAMPGP